jgi:hypothetical protein
MIRKISNQQKIIIQGNRFSSKKFFLFNNKRKNIYLLHKCLTTSFDLKPSNVYRRLANRRADGRSTDLLTVSEITGTIKYNYEYI